MTVKISREATEPVAKDSKILFNRLQAEVDARESRCKYRDLSGPSARMPEEVLIPNNGELLEELEAVQQQRQ
jgi:hypothetical protein